MYKNIKNELTLPSGWDSWESLMREALAEAKKAQDKDEVPVGAIVVDQCGKILGRGFNCPISTLNPTAHAEVAAIKDAARCVENYRLINAYLVVTLEPCLMCAGAIIHSRIKGVIYGAHDYKTGALHSQTNALDLPFHNHHPAWIGGILENECANIISAFFQKKRQQNLKS